MRPGLFEIGKVGSGNILWVDSGKWVVNGDYKVNHDALTDTVGICPKEHPQEAAALDWRAVRVENIPNSERRDYNTVINEFIKKRGY